MMKSMDPVLAHYRLRDYVLQVFRAPNGKSGGQCIDFVGDDPRSLPPDSEKPVIDFIEIRPGAVPEDDMSGSYCREHAATPFQSTPWLVAWHSKFSAGKGEMPLTAIGYSAGTPVFMLPLAVIKKFGVRILSWQAYSVSDYCAPIVGPDRLAQFERLDGPGILRQIAERIGAIDLVYVPKLPADVAGVSNPFVLEGAFAYHVRAHAVSLPLDKSWESLFQGLRSGKTRRRIREKLSALEKLGDVKFNFASTREEATEIVRRCLAAKSRQLREQCHWDPFAEPGVRDFLTDHFSSDIGKTTWACSYSVGGEITATAFGFRHPNTWLLYQMALEDTDKARFSPGTHMLLCLMKHCLEQKVTMLDLGLGDETYKTEWCDIHKSLLVSVLPLTPTGMLVEKALRARSSLRALLASSPKFHDRARRVRGFARKFGLPV